MKDDHELIGIEIQGIVERHALKAYLVNIGQRILDGGAAVGDYVQDDGSLTWRVVPPDSPPKLLFPSCGSCSYSAKAVTTGVICEECLTHPAAMPKDGLCRACDARSVPELEPAVGPPEPDQVEIEVVTRGRGVWFRFVGMIEELRGVGHIRQFLDFRVASYALPSFQEEYSPYFLGHVLTLPGSDKGNDGATLSATEAEFAMIQAAISEINTAFRESNRV